MQQCTAGRTTQPHPIHRARGKFTQTFSAPFPLVTLPPYRPTALPPGPTLTLTPMSWFTLSPYDGGCDAGERVGDPGRRDGPADPPLRECRAAARGAAPERVSRLRPCGGGTGRGDPRPARDRLHRGGGPLPRRLPAGIGG